MLNLIHICSAKEKLQEEEASWLRNDFQLILVKNNIKIEGI